MKKAIFVSLILAGVLLFGSAHADTIAGPSNLGTTGMGTEWYEAGLEIEALTNTTMTSFTFQNQGNPSTIELGVIGGSPLYTYSYQGNTPTNSYHSDTISVSWALAAGTTYYLWSRLPINDQNIYTQKVNCNYTFSSYPVADSQIEVLAGYGWDGSGFSSLGPDSRDWFGFNNIVTGTAGSSAVPLPPAMLLLAPGLAGLAAIKRRFKK